MYGTQETIEQVKARRGHCGSTGRCWGAGSVSDPRTSNGPWARPKKKTSPKEALPPFPQNSHWPSRHQVPQLRGTLWCCRGTGGSLIRCPLPAPPTGRATHHLYGRVAEVGLRHGAVITLHHVNPLPGQSLDDRLVALQGSHLVPSQDEAADAAVQLAGQQELDHRGLDVLLLVLVGVEGVPEALGNVICSGKRSPHERTRQSQAEGGCQEHGQATNHGHPDPPLADASGPRTAAGDTGHARY